MPRTKPNMEEADAGVRTRGVAVATLFIIWDPNPGRSWLLHRWGADVGETRIQRRLGWLLGTETLHLGGTELGFSLLLRQAEAARTFLIS